MAAALDLSVYVWSVYMRIYIFIICLFCGVISGIVYDVLYVARACLCGVEKQNYTAKDKIFIIAADLLYCLAFAAGFVFVSVMFDFETLRFYMLAGCVLGALVYLKSFHIIVAFLVKKAYNKFTVYKEKKSGRSKEKPNSRRAHGKRNIADRNSRRSNHLSVG
ncbi:MAG: spore cortex biosynthesis protein YabQ [Clostridia bacterium]|nr:spore cortex biosynthesis protein YabQ [Clostridia bacterium]